MPISLNEPSWLVVRTVGGRVLRVEELKPNTDLRGTFIVEEHEHRAVGWKSEGIGYGSWEFFMSRAGVRISIGIRKVHPGAQPTP